MLNANKIIRTANRAEGGITEEEEKLLEAHSKKWIANTMSTEPVNKSRLISAIKALYAASNLKEPRIVIVSSPRIMAFAGGFAAAIWWSKKNNNNVIATDAATYAATYAGTDAATYAATRAATYAATDAATRAATYAATYAATRAATDAATYDATDAATDAATRATTDAATDAATRTATDEGFLYIALKLQQEYGIPHEFMLSCACKWWAMYQGGNMWGAWECYISAFRDVLGIKLPQYEKYMAWEACAIEGGFRIMHDEFCIVSDRPEILRVDNENRPHCENGPSHKWRDGWSLYHWHGVKIPGEWVTGSPPSAKEAITWSNIEQRRAACEIVGWGNILKELNAKIIDKDEDEEIGTLIEAEVPDSGKERFLSVKCGTGRTGIVLPVPREMKTALQASAWTYGIDDLYAYKPEVRT